MSARYFNDWKAAGNNITSTKDLTAGVSWRGVEEYLDEINLNKKKIVKALENVSGMQTAIDAGWQGESKMAFYNDLGDSIHRAIKQVEDETKDLEYRIYEIRDNMYKQDSKMYKE